MEGRLALKQSSVERRLLHAASVLGCEQAAHSDLNVCAQHPALAPPRPYDRNFNVSNFLYYNDTVQRHEQWCCWNGTIEKILLLLLTSVATALFGSGRGTTSGDTALLSGICNQQSNRLPGLPGHW